MDRLTDISDQNARHAIDGAIEFGRQGINPPPDDHWLAPYWHMGKTLAKVEVTERTDALLAAPQQEPVAEVAGSFLVNWLPDPRSKLPVGTKLYASPLSAWVPVGERLVPVEPTQKMLVAAWNASTVGRSPDEDRDVWKAMLAAAPQEKQP